MASLLTAQMAPDEVAAQVRSRSRTGRAGSSERCPGCMDATATVVHGCPSRPVLAKGSFASSW